MQRLLRGAARCCMLRDLGSAGSLASTSGLPSPARRCAVLDPVCDHSGSRGFAAPARDTLKRWNPTSPGQRGRVTVSRDGLWKGKPFKALTVGAAKTGGRNDRGVITVRHRGGGARKKFRLVDFKRLEQESTGVIERLEYDPNRSARIALVRYPLALRDDVFKYILAPQNVGPGDEVRAGADVPIEPGNTLPLWAIPTGMHVHNIEMRPGQGGLLCRSAGTCATLMKNDDGGRATLRLPSAEIRTVPSSCKATIGAVSNPLHKHRVIGKAGINRHLGWRPTVRGVAMNPCDHPHGGDTSGGRPSCTPWGLHTKGRVTRNNKLTDQFIVLSRRKARAKVRR